MFIGVPNGSNYIPVHGAGRMIHPHHASLKEKSLRPHHVKSVDGRSIRQEHCDKKRSHMKELRDGIVAIDLSRGGGRRHYFDF